MSTSPAQRDVALIRAASGGDREALSELTARLGCMPGIVRALHAECAAPLAPEDLAEIAQNALAALWAKLERFDGRSTLESWAYGFCSTEVLKFLERRGRRARLELGLADERLADPEAAAELRRLEFEWVHTALARIGPPAEEVVRLKHFEELTFDEIGARLAIPPNTAKTHYYRAVQRLRGWLRPLWQREEELRP